jgi:hypothetical protein
MSMRGGAVFHIRLFYSGETKFLEKWWMHLVLVSGFAGLMIRSIRTRVFFNVSIKKTGFLDEGRRMIGWRDEGLCHAEDSGKGFVCGVDH